jgi:uncharacterized membrane protein YkoI
MVRTRRLTMRTRTRYIVAAASVAVVGLGIGAAAAVGAATGDDTEAPISGEALELASSAALAHTGEGRVTGTEVGDEESYYEVEVTLDDGGQVDVQLDANFKVVDAAADREDDAGDDSGDDD